MLGAFLGHSVDAPDVSDDEAGGGDEEVVHPVEAPANWLCVHGVMGDSSAGLINHLANTDREEGRCLNHEPDEYIQHCWL